MATSPFDRTPRRRDVVDVRCCSCSPAARRTSVARTAGTSAKSAVQMVATSAVKRTSLQSAPAFKSSSAAVRLSAGDRAPAIQFAITRPHTLPSAASSRPSVASCRMTRRLEAPMATLTAISRTRAWPLARRRLATIAHATRRTTAVIAAMTRNVSRVPSRNSI